ncbi:N-acetylmuramoyl-L-alanine amidase [Oceanobacillus saliphilus]|uniref:N-acetylmuramoyl-L-alanine amidase n=1 Tax=Oceanobacillus saliphilus TaxID=2925834 RepID=UPI00201D7035|nr:N-acetylmuramoyl-L-alanine amidase [Oceanobacillus saliphilus]
MKNFRNSLIGICFLLFLSFLLPATAHANEGQTYEVSTNILNVRSEPAADATVVGYLSKGNKVTAFQEKYGWIQTYYGGKEAWVAKHHLVPVGNMSNLNQTVTQTSENSITVTAGNVNVRSGPSMDHSIIGSTGTGNTYKLVETAGDWHKVDIGDGSFGWIAAWLTDAATPQVASTSVNANDSTVKPAASGSLEGYTIVLDPGHGGRDPGAIGLGGIYEKDLVYSTATKVADQLRNAGATVIATRTGDYYVSLNERVHISNASHTDAFVSLHYDSYPALSVKGISTYYTTNYDRDLAQQIQSSLASSVTLNNRGIMQGNYRVLRNTTAPSVLVELGFISNQSDLAIIQTADYQHKVAEAITTGLINYFD